MSRRFYSDDFSWNTKHGFRWASSMIRSSTSSKHSSWLRWNPPTAWMPLFSKSLSIGVSVWVVKSCRISSLDQNEKVLEDHENKNQLLMDNLNNKHYLVLRELLRLLEHGLKERLYLICPLPASDQTRNTVSSWFLAKRDGLSFYSFQWAINETVPTRSTATFGLLFSDQYDLTVLKGPENATKEVSESWLCRGDGVGQSRSNEISS